MPRESSATTYFVGAVVAYSIVSKIIFDNVYLTSKQVIDEEFHIPQGLAYCNFHFDTVSYEF